MSETKKISLIIVDDNPYFLEGITAFLSKQERYEVLAKFSSGPALLEEIENYDPDVILLDIEMLWVNGMETAKRLNSFGMRFKLIAVTMYYDGIYIKKLIEAGFMGFVNKNNVSENLNEVIDTILKGEISFPETEKI
jgi:two-component system, NarL family, nitrate/nitrite response regulator NarL